jgi:2-polyprenyl-3-methyl-5-hydroxy-6-metoxy-1,4-benzoquinol methylase
MPATMTTEQTWTIERDEAASLVLIRSPHLEQIAPDDWRERFARALRRNPGAAIVGAKRLDDEEGKLFSMGEHVVHPKGYHFLGKGEPATSFRFPEEVDAISGGVLAVAAEDFDAVEGASLCDGELGALMLCLAIRERGGRCLCLPSVVATDGHSPSPSADEERRFEERFGFDWLAPDLETFDEGSPFLWNPRFQGVALPFEKYDQRQAMHWKSYAEVEVYRKRADHIITLCTQLAGKDEPVLDLGCGDGLFTHLAALKGLRMTGLDPEQTAIEQATQLCAKQNYPAEPPTFELGSGDGLSYEDGSFKLVYMLDVIEHLPNPVTILREAARVIQPGGHLLITTPAWQFGKSSDPTYHVTEYAAEELVRQVAAATRRTHPLLTTNLGKIGGVYRDLVLIAQRRNAT